MTPYINVFTGTTAFVALSAVNLGFKGTIRAGSGNGSAIQIQDAVIAVPISLAAGVAIPFEKVNLAALQIKGNALTLEVIGVTDVGWIG